MSPDVLQLLSAFCVPHLVVSEKKERYQFAFDLKLLLHVCVCVRVCVCARVCGGVSFTLTVPSKDQDSSLVSAGELESSEKLLTCSL